MHHIGVIGGSGIYQLEGIETVQEHDLTTPFGKPSSPVIEATIQGHTFFFIPRHGKGHRYLPSEVNYRANVYALKMMGVKSIVSVSAVGSLQEEYAPTDFVLPSQFIDWTKGKRERSFFGEGIVGHVSTAYPVEKVLMDRIADHCEKAGIKYHTDKSYLCIEGPQFSSRAESMIYRGFGADIIGMTNVPESYLAKEAGMAYATVAMVTDYDCWKEEHCSVEEIMKVMGANYKSAQKLLSTLLPDLIQNPIEFQPENKNAVMTNPELLSKEQIEMIDTLLH